MTVAEKTIVTPFGIEIDCPRNSDIIIQSIPGCRMRGGIDPVKPVVNSETGESTVPVDQIINMGQIPKMPGQQLHVNPADLKYMIVDPLCEDETLCNRFTSALVKSGSIDSGARIVGVPTKTGTLDVHRMKTLVREMVWILDCEHGKIAKGVKPDMEDIGKLPGNFLLNPGCREKVMQPTFEKDFDKWYERMGGFIDEE